MAGLRSRQEALRRMLEEQGIDDGADPQIQSVGLALDTQGINDDGETISRYGSPGALDAKVIGNVGMPEITRQVDENGVESQWLDDEQLAAQERQDIEGGSVPATLQASLDQTAEIPEEFRKPTFTGPEPKMSLAVGDPTVTKRVPKPVPQQFSVGMGAPTPEQRPFQSLLGPKLEPEQADAVYKMAAEQAGPQGKIPSKTVGAPEPSPEERMRLAMELAQKEADRNEGWGMIQRAGANLGGAIGGQDVDQSFYDRYEKSAQRPVERLKESQAIERSGLEKKAERDRLVNQFVLEQRAKTDANAARLLEENRRRAEDRGFKTGDEASKRTWETEQHRLDRASRERAASNMAGVKADEGINRDVETLSKRLEAVPAMKNDLATLTEYASREDIPGVGPYASRAPAWAPGISEEDVKSRQAAKGLLGAILKEQSGTTVSEGELSRKLEELGMGPGATEQQFREGLKRLTKNAHDTIRGKEAGARPGAVEEGRRRGLTTSADLPQGQTGSSAPMKMSVNGRTYVRQPNGKYKAQ